MRFDREGWERHLLRSDFAPATVRAYRALGIRLADWCLTHDVDPHRPDERAVAAWSSTLTQSRALLGQARGTVKAYATWQGLDDDLQRAVPLPSAPRRPRWRSLPPDVVRDLLDAAEDAGDAGTAVLFGLFAALRRSEIAAVRWEHVDWERRQFTVWRVKNRDWHLVPLHDRLHARLEPRALRDGWVFPGRWGGHVAHGTISDWVARVARAAGHAEVTPHQLRHTCATAVYDATRDLVLAQTLLGHRRPETTALYVRPNRAALAAAVGAIDYRAP